MDSLAIDALLITAGESEMPSFERRDSAVHLAAERLVYDVMGAGDAVIGRWRAHWGRFFANGNRSRQSGWGPRG
jgi:bifunctional ADP-heptose synthase (sugar kinase/adenylyltransferase)